MVEDDGRIISQQEPGGLPGETIIEEVKTLELNSVESDINLSNMELITKSSINLSVILLYSKFAIMPKKILELSDYSCGIYETYNKKVIE